MSKKVHPYAHRLMTLRGWKSRWFAEGDAYKENLVSDMLIRNWILKNYRNAYISSVEIERGQKASRIIIKTSRPGIIIGRQGEGAKKLKSGLAKFLKTKGIVLSEDVRMDVQEIENPDADAAVVAYSIAEALEKRMPFKKVIRQAMEKIMSARGVQGARIIVSGRLNGADIARTEEIKKGSIPLQTFRADVDFAKERARLSYGTLGIKVWIYRGLVFGNERLSQTSKNK